jgi:CheY-like chemotaxis protein
LREASRAAARGAALTGQLMAFAGNSPISSERVAVVPFLAGLAEMVGRSFAERHAVVLHPAEPDLTVECDPRMLETVLLGLLINARDAMPEGGCITLDVRRTEAEGERGGGNRATIAIAVSDTGHGMTATQMAQAVEPFYTTKAPGEGSGLGLSMAQGFARQSGGALHLESAPGCGTTVTLALPDAAPVAANTVPESGAVMPPLDILLVEDDASVRKVAVAVLERLGALVVPVATAEEALEMVSSGVTFDLLFSDIVLGAGIDGFELGRRVHRVQPGIGLLFTSGYNEVAEEVRRSPELKGSELLPKPYSVGALQAAVHRAVARAKASETGPRTARERRQT